MYVFVHSVGQLTLTACFLSLGTWGDTKKTKTLEAGEGVVMEVNM